MVVLVTTQVTTTMSDQARARLDAVSRSIGQQLLDRLLIADDSLRQLNLADNVRGSRPFESVAVVTGAGTDLLLGEPFDIPQFAGEGDSRSSLSVAVSDAGRSIYLAHGTEAGTVIGKLDERYLWQSESLLPYAMDLCVMESASRVFLHCTREAGESGRRAIVERISGVSASVSWREDGAAMLGGYWELFLPSRFNASPWSLLVSQPESVALAPLAAFNRVFPFVAGIGLLLTLLLSAGQVRRIMQPLEKLLAGTRRFADRDFSAPIALTGENEFSELAGALNDMAVRLEGQFDTITALADIDRLILSSQSINEVLERVLDRLVALSPEMCASVVLLDPDHPERGQVFSRLPGDAITTLHTRVSMPQSARHWLASVSAGSTQEGSWIRRHLPELPTTRDPGAATVIPLFRAHELRGALIVQMPGELLPQQHRGRLVELAGRLAVAVSAADHESELFRRAHFDALTGLPNRQLCLDRLYQAIAQARREAHRLALLFIDLDRFKNVNDSLGHALGDELLREIAFRLTTSVRDTDTVSRLGGDEFVIILPHIAGLLEVEQIVAKINSVLSRPFEFNGSEVAVSASIGITLFPDDATDADALLQKADTAMYVAKDTGRARTEFFQEEMDRSLKERLRMQQDLRHAFAKGQFSLVYQPQLDLDSGKLLGMEALLRWHHDQLGAIAPSTFIPVLEDMGMIGTVGRWVLDTALADFARWRKNGLTLPRIAVNVAGQQLREEDLEPFIVERLQAHGLNGCHLEIELTEHSLIKDFDLANQVLGRLCDHGIGIALDDFGTGYSSLGYLQDLRFDALKIDRAFVAGLPNAKSIAIVEAVLGVAKALGKKTIAEGIDSERQRLKLVELGCHIGQGYLLSLPIAGDEVVQWSKRLDETSVIQKLVASGASLAT